MATSTTSSGTINITGLTTGIDSTSIIQALVSTKQQPITALQTQETKLNQQKTTFNTVQSQVSALATLADGMTDLQDVAAKKATSSNAAVGVAVSGAAQASTFDVQVTQLASAFKTYSNGVSARDQGGLFGTGTITIQDGSGAPITINVDASTTLDTLGEQISESDPNLNVAMVYDGTNYHMQVTSSQTGKANDVTMTENGTTLGFMDAANLRSTGQDAQFSVDGIPMTRPSNTVSDAMDGVTFQLNATTASSGAATVAITDDTDAIKSKIQSLVSDYNTLVQTISSNTTAATNSDGSTTAALLPGDQTLLGLQRMLASTIGNSSATATTFTNLSAIGISTQKDGTLTIDDTKLSSALKQDPDAVVGMIADNRSTGTKGLASAIASVAHAYGDAGGLVSTRVNGITSETSEIDTQVDEMQQGVTAYQAQLEAKYANLESMVSQWKNYASSITNAIGQKSSG